MKKRIEDKIKSIAILVAFALIMLFISIYWVVNHPFQAILWGIGLSIFTIVVLKLFDYFTEKRNEWDGGFI